MPTMKNTDVLIPSLVEEAVKKAFSGFAAMQGTGAVVTKTSLADGAAKVGSKVIIPFFENIGEAEEILTDGDPASTATFSYSTTEATVRHFAKGISATYLAQNAADDPYGFCAAQIVEACKRSVDKVCYDEGCNETGWSSYIKDASAGIFSTDALLDTMAFFGDQPDDYAALIVHSKVKFDMFRLKDSTGRPILTDPQVGAPPLLRAFGIPVVTSDRVKVNAGVYSNLLLKKNSLATWIDGNVRVRANPNAAADKDELYAHIYFATARYKYLSGSDKPGVGILKTK